MDSAQRTRRAFLTGAGAAGMLALVNVTLGGTAAGAAPPKASLQELTDADILNSALVLEFIGIAFGEEALRTRLLRPGAVPFFRAAGRNGALRGRALGDAIRAFNPNYEVAQRRESYNFGDTGSEAALLSTAVRLSTIAGGGYTGGAALLTQKSNLALAASAGQGMARQLAVYRYLNGESFSPASLANVLTPSEVEQAISPILGG
jgi:hypothetical protein